MGLQAVLHDLLTEAGRRREAGTRYADRRGATRPAYDPVLAALLLNDPAKSFPPHCLYLFV